MGCSTTDFGYRNQLAVIKPDDSPLIVQFKRTLGDNWYRVKFFDLEVGRAHRVRSIAKKNGMIVYRIAHEEELVLQIHGQTIPIQRTLLMDFSSSPPYNLISYDLVENSGNNHRTLQFKPKGPDTYDFIYNRGGQQKHQTRKAPLYSLEKALELEMWAMTISGNSGSTSVSSIPLMEIYSLISGELDAKVVSFQEEPVDGQQSKVRGIEVESNDIGKIALEVDDSGHMLSTNYCDLIQYDRVKFMPLLPSGRDDLNVHNMVPINEKIGRAERIKRLSLVVTGKRANLFESGPMQRIFDGGSDRSIRIVVDTGEHDDARNEITTKDREQYSQTISDTIADQEEIDKLAKQAVVNTTSSEERIDKLVKFVSDYIDDKYVFESNLHQLLTGKIGDCSEHALLFSALARSLGIPCRKVLGLVYMGDWCQGFGLHAWNEVMLNGYWKAVDASRGAVNIPPVYIRFPDDPVKLISLIGSLHHMEISIVDIELMKDAAQ